MRRAALTLAVVLPLWWVSQQIEALAHDERATWPKVEESLFVPPPEVAPFLSLGYRDAVADLSWIRVVQYHGSSIIGESDFRYLTPMIDNVLALDPDFRRVYRWAAYNVTHKAGAATQAEIELSTRYLRAAAARYPETYEYMWLLGVRLWNDGGRTEAERKRFRAEAAELIERAIHKPDAPPNLPTLAASLYSQLGQFQRAEDLLLEQVMATRDDKARERMLERFRLLTDNDELTQLVRKAKRGFDERHSKALPWTPPGLFVLIGDRPDPVIDFDKLATERDLFGVRAEPSPAATAP